MTLIRITPRDRLRRERRAVALALGPTIGLGAAAAVIGNEVVNDQPFGSALLAVVIATAVSVAVSARVPRSAQFRRLAGVPAGAAPDWFAALPAIAATLTALTGAAIGAAFEAFLDGSKAPLWVAPLVVGPIGVGLLWPRGNLVQPPVPPAAPSGRVIRISQRGAPAPTPAVDFDDGDDDDRVASASAGGLTIRSPQQTTCAGCKQPIAAREQVSFCCGSARHKVHTECANVLCNNKCPECGHRVP